VPDAVADALGPRRFDHERFERHACASAQARACCLDLCPGRSEIAGGEQPSEAQDGDAESSGDRREGWENRIGAGRPSHAETLAQPHPLEPVGHRLQPIIEKRI
jgi:hypothetical protein